MTEGTLYPRQASLDCSRKRSTCQGLQSGPWKDKLGSRSLAKNPHFTNCPEPGFWV